MARRCAAALAALSLWAVAFPAFAAKGVVVYYRSGCDYYIIESRSGYALLEWYGGNDPDEGDVIVGEFERYGLQRLHNLTRDQETSAYVEDYGLSRGRVVEKYHEKCDDD